MSMMTMPLGQLKLSMGKEGRLETSPVMGFVFRPQRLVLHIEPGPVLDVNRFYVVHGRYRGKSRRKGRRASHLASLLLLRIRNGGRVDPVVYVVNVTVGVNSQFAAPGERVPAGVFGPSAFDVFTELEPSSQGKVIAVDFVNDDARDVVVAGTFVGRATRAGDVPRFFM